MCYVIHNSSIARISSNSSLQEFFSFILDSFYSKFSLSTYPRGIVNLGQSCYISCVLQSFFSLPPVLNFFLSEGHPPVNCSNSCCMACQLDSFIQAKLAPDISYNLPIIPSELLQKVGNLCHLYRVIVNTMHTSTF
ncbi:hypothetical protein GEMRC1_002677 [Eukaryota sp. GEM-RC1]